MSLRTIQSESTNPPVKGAVVDCRLPTLSPLAVTTVGKWRSKLSNSVTRRVMTLDRLYALIAQGFGQGRDEAYKPWIRVTRSLSSPKSNVFVAQVPIHERGLHLLAGTEYNAGQLASWLGALEVREQFPLWPSPSRSPLWGLHPERDRTLVPAPGLLEIAADAGIDHGTYVGGNIPFVATTDLVLRIGVPPNDKLVFWSVKPLEKIVRGKSAARIRERLELERRYAVAVGAHHGVIDGTEMTRSLVENLDWFRPLRSELLAFRKTQCIEDFAAAFEGLAVDGDPLRVCIDAAGEQCSIPPNRVQAFFRAATWLGLTDVDLGVSVLMTKPPTRGGGARKLQLRKALLGDAS